MMKSGLYLRPNGESQRQVAYAFQASVESKRW